MPIKGPQTHAKRLGKPTYHGKPHSCGSTLRNTRDGHCARCRGKPKDEPKEPEPKVKDPRPVCRWCRFRFNGTSDDDYCGMCKGMGF